MHPKKPMSFPSGAPALRPGRRIAPDAEFERWMAKYTPVERKIMEERARRLAAAEKRRFRRRLAFAAECEATEGLAKAMRRKGAMRRNGPGGKASAAREWPGRQGAAGIIERDGERLVRIGDTNLHVIDGSVLAVLLSAFGLECTREVDSLRHRIKRPLYYERENARRRMLAAERRKVRKCTTSNACPTREEVLDAWVHAKDSREAMLRFGGMMEDLECYVDNSLRFGPGGEIVGREAGIKGWLQTNIPALYAKYTTVMRYKAAAKKLRQVVELKRPTPVSAILCPPERRETGDARGEGGKGENEITLRTKSNSADGARGTAGGARGTADDATGVAAASVEAIGVKAAGVAETMGVEALRARAVYEEAMDGVPDNATRTIARLDELLDPERIEEATMLKAWREKYGNEITLRTKSRWVKRLFKRTG